ncbi:arylsulfatase [Flagellimonas sp.]|uniref:arylsulfatase n=1 Tax=Flagellimonas sp. TaxID=2058762 RepID=UPI003BAECEBD
MMSIDSILNPPNIRSKYILLLVTVFTLLFSACVFAQSRLRNRDFQQPNIVLIMVDDLGYGDLGCYGQTHIKTPNIDRLAKEGVRFTDFYAGSPVCAPSRSVLMTGKHTGHTTVRGNFGKSGVLGLGGGAGRVPLKESDTTVAEVLKDLGYNTAITGKWGLGEPNTSGLPNDQGFDVWFGYLNQRRAHSHFPDYLWKNKRKHIIKLNRNSGKKVFSHSLFTDFAIDYITRNARKRKPFFLYLPYLLPHSAYEMPGINPIYEDRQWSEEAKVYASMVTLIDSDMGRINEVLKKTGILENTLVIFTSDNGAARRWDGIFDSSGYLRGKKRDVYEGGIKVPLIISMPGNVPEGVINNEVSFFGDILPTLSEFAGREPELAGDGVSLKDAILKKMPLPSERILYWEFHEEGGKQAARQGNWKAVRLNVDEKGFHGDLELYNLNDDPKESKDLSKKNPEITGRFLRILDQQHVLSKNYPFLFEETGGQPD